MYSFDGTHLSTYSCADYGPLFLWAAGTYNLLLCAPQLWVWLELRKLSQNCTQNREGRRILLCPCQYAMSSWSYITPNNKHVLWLRTWQRGPLACEVGIGTEAASYQAISARCLHAGRGSRKPSSLVARRSFLVARLITWRDRTMAFPVRLIEKDTLHEENNLLWCSYTFLGSRSRARNWLSGQDRV
jgi:hypothetical protein